MFANFLDFFTLSPLVTFTLMQRINALVCFWGTPPNSLGMSYVDRPQGFQGAHHAPEKGSRKWRHVVLAAPNAFRGSLHVLDLRDTAWGSPS